MGARFDVPLSCSLSGIGASHFSSARQIKNSLALIRGSRKDREPIQDKPAGSSARRPVATPDPGVVRSVSIMRKCFPLIRGA
jgi:hypothetical protein